MTAADAVRVDDASDPPRSAEPGGWLDWLIDRIRAVPGPSWVVYLVMFGVLAVLGHAAGWVSGAVTPGTLAPLLVIQASFAPLSPALVEGMGAVALRSLRTLRPALAVSDAEVRVVTADLVRTPRRLALGAGLAGAAFAVASVLNNPEVYLLHAGVGPVMWVWVLAYIPLTAALPAAATAYVVHLVRVVMRVHRDMVRVDLFRLDPLYAFSNLTALLGIASLAGVAYAVGALFVVGVRFTALELAWFGAIIPVAIVVFVAPLLGLHGRIEAEKARRHTEAGEALNTAVAELNRRLRSGDFEQMGQLNDALAAATSAHATISKISTWPWRPETFRGFLSAIGLPILLWLITALLARLI